MYRLSSLIKEHHPDFKSNPHKALSAPMSARFPVERLAFTWEFAGDPWKRETELFDAYVAEFGELPPNNHRG
jgi:hypothetical protein